jgi:hypothetical protein
MLLRTFNTGKGHVNPRVSITKSAMLCVLERKNISSYPNLGEIAAKHQ